MPRERKVCNSQRLTYLLPLVVGHGYLHLFVRGVAAAVGAGDRSRIDASISVACPLGLEVARDLHPGDGYPVWRSIDHPLAIDRFVARHMERAGIR